MECHGDKGDSKEIEKARRVDSSEQRRNKNVSRSKRARGYKDAF